MKSGAGAFLAGAGLSLENLFSVAGGKGDCEMTRVGFAEGRGSEK